MPRITTDESLDRADWPRGPWDNEPDEIQWPTPFGYPGLILRSPVSGSLCGYVGVPLHHPLVEAPLKALGALAVHGGITFSARGDGQRRSAEYWWFGFDCSHYDDVMPRLTGHFIGQFGEYRDVLYVRTEVEALAQALRSFDKGAGVTTPR